jgi:hypothetical protein
MSIIDYTLCNKGGKTALNQWREADIQDFMMAMLGVTA